MTDQKHLRNLDSELYKQLKVQAMIKGKTIGYCLNEAIAHWLMLIESKKIKED